MRGCLQTKSKRGNRPVVLGMSALPRPNRPQWDQIKRGHGLPVPMQNFFSVSAWGENGVNCFNRPALFKKLQWAVHSCCSGPCVPAPRSAVPQSARFVLSDHTKFKKSANPVQVSPVAAP